MNEQSHDSSAARDDRDLSDFPTDLPPVEPPSAGFIVQLFIVPALIVMVVVGVWALFGKLAAGEHDWRKLTTELSSNNEHVRWRAAMGLAQLLKADQELGDDGQKLTENRLIAEELAKIFREQLNRRSDVTDDDLKQMEFLARTLGVLDVPDATLPALRDAILIEDAADEYRDVRRTSIAAVAMIAGRRMERNQPLEAPELVDDLIDVSSAPDPMLRQISAFALGLLPGESSADRLRVLLADPDGKTRVNAAVGLARNGSTAGFEVFQAVLVNAQDADAAPAPPVPVTAVAVSNSDQSQFEDLLIVKNTLTALQRLADRFTAEQRAELRTLLPSIAAEHSNHIIRLEAAQTLKLLDDASS